LGVRFPPVLIFEKRKLMIEKVTKYFNDTIQELKKVAWPSRDELIGSTIVVVVMSIMVSIFIGVVDQILNGLVNFLAGLAGS
jgi:preprotein translocase subunit SecE